MINAFKFKGNWILTADFFLKALFPLKVLFADVQYLLEQAKYLC
jgi:hypothetical protein